MACLGATGAACGDANGWACAELPTLNPLIQNIVLDNPVLDDGTQFNLSWIDGETGATVFFYLRQTGNTDINDTCAVLVSAGVDDMGTGLIDGEIYVLAYRTVTPANECSEWDHQHLLFTGSTITLIIDGADAIVDNLDFIIDG